MQSALVSPKARAELLVVASAIVAVASLAFAADVARADQIYAPYGAWNGKKIYLSPARHPDAGSRGECGGFTENDAAYYAAWDATNGAWFHDQYNPSAPSRNLRSRGYRVRIGTGTVSSAIANSNAWGATRHVAIHSNAHAYHDCASTAAWRFGTVGIYWNGSSAGQDLARKLKDVIGVEVWGGYQSPGTNDYICYNPDHPCTTITLAELSQTYAPAAYMETEFHTWNTGADWLGVSFVWAWRFGRAIDQHLGWP